MKRRHRHQSWTVLACNAAMLLFLFSCSFGARAASAGEVLRLPIDLLQGQDFSYYRELLVRSLAALGVRATLPVHDTVPQTRMMWNLERGITSLRPLLETHVRNCRLTEVPVDLTDGRIGQRVFLVPRSQKSRFAGVRDLDDLRATQAVAALGQDWFDIRIWRANQLPYQVIPGDWHRIYGMLRVGGRHIDYFPRGINEVLEEARKHPGLVIEPHLLLVYERDFRFYLSPRYAHYEPLIEKALRKARDSGLMARLQRKYWGNVEQALHLSSRQTIHLFTPPVRESQSGVKPRCNNAASLSGSSGRLKK